VVHPGDGRAPAAVRRLGRGPYREAFSARPARSAARIVAAVAVLAIAGLAAWSTAQPQAAVDRADQALFALAEGNVAQARTLAIQAGDIDPLSVDPLFALSEVESAARQPAAAKAALERAVQQQPATPETWIRLAQFELLGGDAAAARDTVRPALYLDPRSAPAQAIFLEATRQLSAAQKTKAKAKVKKKAKQP